MGTVARASWRGVQQGPAHEGLSGQPGVSKGRASLFPLPVGSSPAGLGFRGLHLSGPPGRSGGRGVLCCSQGPRGASGTGRNGAQGTELGARGGCKGAGVAQHSRGTACCPGRGLEGLGDQWGEVPWRGRCSRPPRGRRPGRDTGGRTGRGGGGTGRGVLRAPRAAAGLGPRGCPQGPWAPGDGAVGLGGQLEVGPRRAQPMARPGQASHCLPASLDAGG